MKHFVSVVKGCAADPKYVAATLGALVLMILVNEALLPARMPVRPLRTPEPPPLMPAMFDIDAQHLQAERLLRRPFSASLAQWILAPDLNDLVPQSGPTVEQIVAWARANQRFLARYEKSVNALIEAVPNTGSRPPNDPATVSRRLKAELQWVQRMKEDVFSTAESAISKHLRTAPLSGEEMLEDLFEPLLHDAQSRTPQKTAK